MTSPLQTDASADGVTARVGLTQLRPVPAAGCDLHGRLKAAQARAAASYERTRELWQRTERLLANSSQRLFDDQL